MSLINDVRAGKFPYSVHRVDLDDALRDGLYRKICAVTGQEWSLEREVEWRQTMINRYKPNEDEELFCIPSKGGGAWLSRALIEARMRAAPVIRFTGTADFNNARPDLREREMQDWIDEHLIPLLRFVPELRHALGMDFGRSGDLSCIAPAEIASNLRVRIPFLVELKNVPYNQQLQVLYAIADALPRLSGMVIDSRGNGSYVGKPRTTNTARWSSGSCPPKAGTATTCRLTKRPLKTTPWRSPNMTACCNPTGPSGWSAGCHACPRARRPMAVTATTQWPAYTRTRRHA